MGINIGYTYSEGYRNLKREMYVVHGYSTLQTVVVDFKPATNFYLIFHDYYKVSRNIRCYAQFGWSFKLIEAEIAPKDPTILLNKLNNEYEYPIFFRSPRGLIAAIGLSYKLTDNKNRKKSARKK